MSVVTFELLPDNTRLWVFGSPQPFSEDQVEKLREHMARFLDQWTSHKRELTPAWTLIHNQFVFVGVDERATDLSGCSIDSLVNTIATLETSLGLDLTGSNRNVFYRTDQAAIHSISRPAFRALVAAGAVDESTIVFNNTVQTVGDFRRGLWEVPMKDSWHMKAFGAVPA